MDYATALTEAEAKTLQGIDDTATGLPVRGVHVGPGRHVPMTDDPTSPGWTQHQKAIIEGTSKQYAYAIDDATKYQGRISPTLQTKVDQRKPLPPEYIEPQQVQKV